MRARLAPLLVLALLAGCTAPAPPEDPSEPAVSPSRVDGLWRPALSAHTATVGVSGDSIELRGGLAPFSSPTLALLGTSALALENASWQGHAGRLSLDLGGGLVGPMSLRATEGAFVVTPASVRADAAGLRATIAGSPALRTGSVETVYDGIGLPASLSIPVDAVLVTAAGESFTVRAGEALETTGARLVRPMGGEPLALRVDGGSQRWNGTLEATVEQPRGTLAFMDRSRALDGARVASIAARGSGEVTLARGASGWTIEPFRAEITDVLTDGTPRIGAALRVVPDELVVNGTPNSTARIQLLLVETSRGAVAHLAGHEIVGDADVRFRGHEPYEVTNAMLDAIARAEGPVTPFLALGLGIAIPFVAFAEGIVEAIRAFFPVSLAGSTVAPGEGRLLSFDVVMPEEPREVEILLQAANAEPARAVLRLVPDPPREG